jgi:hypothetical protein
MGPAMYLIEEDLRRSKHFHDDITEAMLVCALRFDGYRYLEVVNQHVDWDIFTAKA